jgi:hypothetical protein
MSDPFGAKLKALEYELPDWCIPPSEELVADYERQFELKLPEDYRSFLAKYGGAGGTSICPFQEPTPVGDAAWIEDFYGFMPPEREGMDVRWATELIEGAPAVVAIAHAGGGMIWLKCTGCDAGHVYFDDGDGRSAWSDEMFFERFPGLADEIKEYLAMRKSGRLPQKPQGYDHVYCLATSFTEFIDALRPSEL